MEILETAATFLIVLCFYFLGCLAIVQMVIKPVKKLVQGPAGNDKHWETNYSKPLAISILLSVVTATVAVMTFP